MPGGEPSHHHAAGLPNNFTTFPGNAVFPYEGQWEVHTGYKQMNRRIFGLALCAMLAGSLALAVLPYTRARPVHHGFMASSSAHGRGTSARLPTLPIAEAQADT